MSEAQKYDQRSKSYTDVDVKDLKKGDYFKFSSRGSTLPSLLEATSDPYQENGKWSINAEEVKINNDPLLARRHKDWNKKP